MAKYRNPAYLYGRLEKAVAAKDWEMVRQLQVELIAADASFANEKAARPAPRRVTVKG